MRRQLPRATVTFLFTDVDGSTRLLHELGAEAYAEALAEHRRLLRAVFAAQGGLEVDTQGDAFFYVFADARAAVAAAAAANVALERGLIRIRMGLHTGEAFRTGDGYVGEDVHLGARIAAAGHGGQVLVSAATRALLDGGVTDLGEHRLKDFAEPLAIFQLGEERFPPLKTISNTSLPRPASSFVGRERETAEVAERVRGHRLVTLTGPGGSGKTRLSIEAASELVGEFKAGVFWIGLAALRDPALVLETVGQTLGARDALVDHIGERELLLLLDNLEQVVDVAPELASLVEVCPNLHLLVTSRELLRVRGEVEYPVPPLAEPEAVTLFCARSRLDPDETIAELCRRLDNLPLAVELAAARIGVLTPPQILDRMAQRLDLLKGGRDAEARQQTLRATIEWSYGLLAPHEQRLFAQLSVFAGGCTLDTAEEIVEADVDRLQSLVDKSLVRRTDERFWMLETIGELARERLAASDDADAIGRRHAEWFLALAEEAAPFLMGAEQPVWLQRLEDEHDNLRAGLDWFFEHDEPELAVRLAAALWVFWYTHGHVTQARRWLRRALDAAPEEPSEALAGVLMGAGYLAAEQNENAEALALLEASLACAKQVGATALAAITAATLCVLRVETGSTSDPRETFAAAEEALAHARAAGEDFALGIVLNNIGEAMRVLGENERARAYWEESLELRRRMGDVSRIALSLTNLGEMALLDEEANTAAAMFAEAAEIATAIGDKRQICIAQAGLGRVAYLEGRWQEAEAHARESLRLAREIGMTIAIVEEVHCLAGIAAATGDVERAARLGSAAELHGSLLATLASLSGAGLHHADIESAKAAGDSAAWEHAWAEGRAMSLDEAADYALSSVDMAGDAAENVAERRREDDAVSDLVR